MTDEEKRRLLKQFGALLPEVRGNLRKNAILKVLRKSDEPLSYGEIISLTQLDYGKTSNVFTELVREGLIRRVAWGMYMANE